MKLLDRYILRQFVVNFIILFFVLYLFSCMIDLFLNLEEFADAASQSLGGGEHGGWERFRMTAILVLDFYWPRFFQFFSFLTGLVAVGAMGFTLAQLHRHRELTAFLSSGVSLHRLAAPIVLATVALSVVQFVNREAMLHRLAPRLLRSHGETLTTDLEEFPVRLAADSAGRVFFASLYAPDTQTLTDLVVWEYDTQGRLRSRVTADTAQWSGTAWRLEGGVRTAAAGSSPADAPELPIGSVAQLETDLGPTSLLLLRFGQFRQMLNLRQIAQLIGSPGPYDVEDLERIRYGRFAQPLINLLTLLVTIPVFLLREPRSLLVQAVKASALGLTAQIGGAVAVLVGLPGVPGFLSVFLFPVLVLLPLSVFLLSEVET